MKNIKKQFIFAPILLLSVTAMAKEDHKTEDILTRLYKDIPIPPAWVDMEADDMNLLIKEKNHSMDRAMRSVACHSSLLIRDKKLAKELFDIHLSRTFEAAYGNQAKFVRGLDYEMAFCFYLKNKFRIEEAYAVDVKIPRPVKYDPLIVEAEKGSTKGMEDAIVKNSKVDSMGFDGIRAIHITAARGDAKNTNLLLASKSNPSIKDLDDRQPLHMAAWNGHVEVIKALLAAGAKVDAKAKNDVQPIHDAAWRGQLEVVKALVAAGADPSAKTKGGSTPLDIAKRNSHKEVVTYLESLKK